MFELVILVLTWIKTVPTLQQIKRTNLGVAGSLSYIVWYNGKFPTLRARLVK